MVGLFATGEEGTGRYFTPRRSPEGKMSTRKQVPHRSNLNRGLCNQFRSIQTAHVEVAPDLPRRPRVRQNPASSCLVLKKAVPMHRHRDAHRVFVHANAP